MNVIEHNPQTFFLLKANAGYYLDVNCSRSFVGFTITVRLNDNESAQYEASGLAYAKSLAEDVNKYQDKFAARQVDSATAQQIHQAIITWRDADSDE